MRSGWEKVTVGEIAHVLRGASPRPKGDSRYYGGNIPRLMVADVTRDGKYVTPSIDFLTESGAKLSRPMPKGTLTIVCSGDVGTPSFLAVDACIHDGFLAIDDVSDRCDMEYLYEVFTQLKTKLERSATHGGVFTNLTTDILRKFEFWLPPLSEQKKIAAILRTWDQAIEKYKQYLNLKEKAWRAFRTQAIASLAKKYGALSIEECSQRIVGGGTPSRHNASYWGGTIPWVSVKDMIAPVLSDTQEHITATALKESASNLIPAFTPIIVTRMAVGRMAYFTVDVAINQDLKAVIPTENFEALYIFHCLKALEGKIAALGTGSTVAGVTLDVIREQVIPTPPKKIQAKFVTLADCHEKEIVTIQKQIALIQSQKRGLMQKLLTGAWRVTPSKEAA